MRLPVPGAHARSGVTTLGWFLLLVVLAGVAAGLLMQTNWLVLAGLAALAVVVALAIRRRTARGASAKAGYVAVREDALPVPVPSGPLREPVEACLRCGSLDLATPALRDGVWPGGGELQFLVCRRCNTRAPPLTFDRAEDYVAFVRELHERPSG